MRPQVQNDVAGLEVDLFQVQQLVVYRVRRDAAGPDQGKEGEQILTGTDGYPLELRHHIAQQGNAWGPLLHQDLVLLPQLVAKEAIMNCRFRVPQDLGDQMGGVSYLFVSLKNLLRAGLNGGVLVSANRLWHGPLYRHLETGVPVDCRFHFIVGADAKPPGDLVPVQINLLQRYRSRWMLGREAISRGRIL